MPFAPSSVLVCRLVFPFCVILLDFADSPVLLLRLILHGCFLGLLGLGLFIFARASGLHFGMCPCIHAVAAPTPACSLLLRTWMFIMDFARKSGVFELPRNCLIACIAGLVGQEVTGIKQPCASKRGSPLCSYREYDYIVADAILLGFSFLHTVLGNSDLAAPIAIAVTKAAAIPDACLERLEIS